MYVNYHNMYYPFYLNINTIILQPVTYIRHRKQQREIPFSPILFS